MANDGGIEASEAAAQEPEGSAAEVKPPPLIEEPPPLPEPEPAVEVKPPALVDEPPPAEDNDEGEGEPLGGPTLRSIEPAEGPLEGGTAVRIVGSAFEEGCRVLIDGAEVPSTRDDDTSLRFATPARDHAGYVDVRVTGPDGRSEVRVHGFRYNAAPVLTSVSPACVAIVGGAALVILGADMAEGCSVLAGETPLEATRIDATRIEAIAPAHPVDEVSIAVVNPDGQRAVLKRALRFDEPPEIVEIAPRFGSIDGGTEATLLGRNLEEGCAVLVAGAPAASVVRETPTRLRFVTPRSAAAGPADVSVVNPTGIDRVLVGGFDYTAHPPRIEAVAPDAGPSAGGTRLTVRGADFAEGCAVFVCGIEVRAAWKDGGELEVVTPAVSRDGPADVKVQNADGQSSTAAGVFRYAAPLPPPVLRAVSPAKGSQLGGLKVAVLGDDFAEGVTVRFGGTVAAVKFLTRKELEAVTPARAVAGEVSVEVQNPDGTAALLDAAFVYEARPAPAIASVHPPNGPTIGGTKIVIEGSNFDPSCFVYIGRELPKDVVIKSSTEIHVVTGARKTAGVVDVEVGGPDLPKAALKNGFRYDAVPAPTITSVSPNRVGTGGGAVITIEGQNFLKETIVLFDGKPAPPRTVKLVDKSTIEVKAPSGDGGKMADVAVRNPDGKEAVSKRAFVFDPRYG
jgi:hypothetical protein